MIKQIGLGTTTELPDFDFETYSPAGFVWNTETKKWDCPRGAAKKGLPVVGAAKYVEHPDAEVLSLAFNLKDGSGAKIWRNFDSQDILKPLFEHVRSGGILEAWNCGFEYWVWTKICIKKYGWPPLQLHQLRDAMAKARAFALPGKLNECAKVLKLSQQKDKRGTRLLEKFSRPRNPTKLIPAIRNIPFADDADSVALWEYNLQDIRTEAEASSRIPDLSGFELKFWQCDQRINVRGVAIDIKNIKNCIDIIEGAYLKYNKELFKLTDGQVSSASEVQKIVRWLNTQGIVTDSLDIDSIERLLKNLASNSSAYRVLEIRNMLGSASVKKLYAMLNQVADDGRLHDLFIYHSARTGRAAGAGPQPQNLPNSGPELFKCGHCKKHYRNTIDSCPWCGASNPEYDITKSEWQHEIVEEILPVINTGSLECVEYYYSNPIEIISGCLRSLFVAAEGHNLICSDYSAIEAVVLAALAGEKWRLDVFNTHGKIYEMSASKITGIPFEEFEKYKMENGHHHPMRKKVGKVAELASGYQGWIGAWRAFGADEFFNEDEIKKAILAWRAASPAIVEMWGGQPSYRRSEFYGIEGAAAQAISHPGNPYFYKNISYLVYDNILYCTLPSGRKLIYHKPTLSYDPVHGKSLITYKGWNTNINMGAYGWVDIQTWGGRLVENIVQAVARDILAHAIVNLENAGYPVVLHVHDEIVCEIPEGFGSLDEFESIMSTMPDWAKDWPIKAKGGWIGKRYRK